MVTDVSWMLELNIQPGREKDFRVLMEEMVSATRNNEAGTLNYEWSTSADGSMCHLFERYVDSAAVRLIWPRLAKSLRAASLKYSHLSGSSCTGHRAKRSGMR